MATLIGDGITVDSLAKHFGTIGYEVLTSLGSRYARVYKGGNVEEPLTKPVPASTAEQPPSPPPIEQPAAPPPLPT